MLMLMQMQCNYGAKHLRCYMILLIYLISNAFVGSRPWYWHVFEIREMLDSNYFASATFQCKL
jgi:hypothetical protein